MKKKTWDRAVLLEMLGSVSWKQMSSWALSIRKYMVCVSPLPMHMSKQLKESETRMDGRRKENCCLTKRNLTFLVKLLVCWKRMVKTCEKYMISSFRWWCLAERINYLFISWGELFIKCLNFSIHNKCIILFK